MAEIEITCPECGARFPLGQLLRQDIETTLRTRIESEAKSRARALSEREKKIGERERGLQKELDDVEERIADEVKKKEVIIRQHVEKDVAQTFELQLEDLAGALETKGDQLKEAQKKELAWRKKERQMEERAAQLDLEVARKLAEERRAVEASIRDRMLEEHKLKDAEKDRKIADAEKQVEELRRRLGQGSQQLQGDVLEVSLEEVLASAFPIDGIEPVPSGAKGADIIQTVKDQLGRDCGIIVWEVKRTKNWSDSWIPKLKEDLGTAKGNIGVIASTALPEDVSVFELKDGVWLTEPRAVVPLATALRSSLIQIAAATVALQGMARKSEAVYGYLISTEFRMRIEAIVEAFETMKNDLDSEKRAIQRQWAKREKQIERTISSTVGLYGDLQGIIGGALRTIPELEMGMTGDHEHGRLLEANAAGGQSEHEERADVDEHTS